MAHRWAMEAVQRRTSSARYISHHTSPKYQYPISSLAKEKGITRVATKMSADAKDTKNKFCGALRARLVNTAMTTSTLPNTVSEIMIPTSTLSGRATRRLYGAASGRLWLVWLSNPIGVDWPTSCVSSSEVYKYHHLEPESYSVIPVFSDTLGKGKVREGNPREPGRTGHARLLKLSKYWCRPDRHLEARSRCRISKPRGFRLQASKRDACQQKSLLEASGPKGPKGSSTGAEAGCWWAGGQLTRRQVADKEGCEWFAGNFSDDITLGFSLKCCRDLLREQRTLMGGDGGNEMATVRSN
ncbi:hypothetical protein EYF80_027627 [Liparis tanakae]|uniref:Uncharacterized protein n=1 Tax=Liparis tanakae TaxID=230148 RepID=A0A4Z2H899_9TELE|nr:hypothetical protein EYF80_027627 [Liparis tanakae]